MLSVPPGSESNLLARLGGTHQAERPAGGPVRVASRTGCGRPRIALEGILEGFFEVGAHSRRARPGANGAVALWSKYRGAPFTCSPSGAPRTGILAGAPSNWFPTGKGPTTNGAIPSPSACKVRKSCWIRSGRTSQEAHSESLVARFCHVGFLTIPGSWMRSSMSVSCSRNASSMRVRQTSLGSSSSVASGLGAIRVPICSSCRPKCCRFWIRRTRCASEGR